MPGEARCLSRAGVWRRSAERRETGRRDHANLLSYPQGSKKGHEAASRSLRL